MGKTAQAKAVHVHSMRLMSGHEALVARLVSASGKVGFGFSFRLDATEARHMAAWSAGLRKDFPEVRECLGHPWEKAWNAREPVEWQLEPGFGQLAWITEEQ